MVGLQWRKMSPPATIFKKFKSVVVGDVSVSVAPDRKLRAIRHCAPCSLFVAVSSAGFVAGSFCVLECSYVISASLPFAQATSTVALTTAPIINKQRPLTAAAPTYRFCR